MDKEAKYREMRDSIMKMEQCMAESDRLKETKTTLTEQNALIDKEIAVRFRLGGGDGRTLMRR
jgi:hypothetical protein